MLLSVVAGLVIGVNRGEHGRPAGMRTTLLVCLAASLSMIQANLLMSTVGKAQDSFVVLDLMRLPLGILSGMGFIGAGAILRKDSVVLGVTTAATLWFTTVMGLCFGGGQLWLGVTALILGLGTLWGLKYVERGIKHDVRGTLTLFVAPRGPSDDEIRAAIARCHCTIVAWGIEYGAGPDDWRQVRCDVEHRVLPTHTRPPEFVPDLSRSSDIRSVRWLPQGLTTPSSVQQSEPAGTPVSISRPK
ncbi:MAG TPA: MgtC/SapB family protein [Gemmatimonadaceae bacterium]|nr:MgtC/SapB family protein [Gemmatimonadaceae bacterium]